MINSATQNTGNTSVMAKFNYHTRLYYHVCDVNFSRTTLQKYSRLVVQYFKMQHSTCCLANRFKSKKKCIESLTCKRGSTIQLLYEQLNDV